MTRYKYSQESDGFKVDVTEFCDALEDTNEVRQILDDLGELLHHSKFDDVYPKDGTSGGSLGVLNFGLDASKSATPAVNDMYLATDTLKIYRCFVAEAWVQVYPAIAFAIPTIQHLQDVRAADDDYIHAAITGTGATLEVTTGITNPDKPRNTSVKTTNVSSPSGNVIIDGINTQGVADTDTIAIIAGSTAYGVVAFATISKVTLPAGVTVDDTVTIGISDKIGLILPVDSESDVYKKTVNSIDESDEISGNVDTTNNTLDCATIVDYEDVIIWFIGR
jgi:hypothetical protein